MFFNHKPAPPPSAEVDFISMAQIGSIGVEAFENGRVQEVVETVPEPKRQFDGPKRLFPQEPVRRCQEWMVDVVHTLGKEGVLEDFVSPRSSMTNESTSEIQF
ncbi:hypothetical protein ONS96_004970 [Cadophora gregata f. sp. sojae]|nr:hypothetical protein ONS96_004970 [Cadophora gregata f. sp. sojae]